MKKRVVKRGYRSNLLSKATPEQFRQANEMANKNRGISKLTMDDLTQCGFVSNSSYGFWLNDKDDV